MKTLLLASFLMVTSISAFSQSTNFKTADYNQYQTVKSKLTQVALAKIKPEFVDQFKQTVNSLLSKMRAQPGNISYTYAQSQEDPTEFIFNENWIDGLSIKNHMESKLVQDFFAVVGPYFEAGFPQLLILKTQGDNAQ